MKKMTSLAIAIAFMLGFGIASNVYAGEYDDGRQWAANNGVIDDDYRSDNSEEFDNGVRQYAIEQQQLQEQSE